MEPADLTDALSWALRIAYPLAAVVLWRRNWVPGAWFQAYLAAAGVAMWAYDPNTLSRSLLTTALLYPLQLAVTVELCVDLIFDSHAEVQRRLMRAQWMVAVVGTAISWGFRYPVDAWGWLGFARTAADSACALMLAMVMGFVGYERMRAHWIQWVHAVIWLAYLAPQIVAGMLRPHLTDDDYGAERWDVITSGVLMITLGCLGLWIWFGMQASKKNGMGRTANKQSSRDTFETLARDMRTDKLDHAESIDRG